MSIAPTPPATGDPPASVVTARLSRVDGCPECLDYNTPEAIQPLPTLAGCFIAWYECAACGHLWKTSWTDN